MSDNDIIIEYDNIIDLSLDVTLVVPFELNYILLSLLVRKCHIYGLSRINMNYMLLSLLVRKCHTHGLSRMNMNYMLLSLLVRKCHTHGFFI